MMLKRTNRAMASFALAIVFTGITSLPLAAQDQSGLLADLVQQLQQLQEEVRQLRGQVEQQSFELEQLKQQQRDQYLDLDQRISGNQAIGANVQDTTLDPNAEGGSRPPLVAPPVTDNSAAVASADPAAAVEETAPDTLQGMAQTETGGAGTQDPRAMYDAAFNNLKQLQYVAAAEGFLGFLEQYPDHDLAGNAQYWLGESYYVTRNYDLALQSFQDLLADYPDSNKVPDAWLKIGFTHYEMKSWDDARRALTRVREQYPDTTLSQLADNRLRTMQLEGHF